MNNFELELLKKLNVPCRSTSDRFYVCDRLEVIKQTLSGSAYSLIEEAPLFLLYAKKPLDELSDNLVVVSSHVDCVSTITNFFADLVSKDTIYGTFDNSITNTSAIINMLEGALPDNVVFAFTGDEERGSAGARKLTRYLERNDKKAFVIVLDVTYSGYDEGYYFSIENDFIDDNSAQGDAIVKGAYMASENWCFATPDPLEPSSAIPRKHYLLDDDGQIEISDVDESYTYADELDCFSLCIPVDGNMHSNRGCTTRTICFDTYNKALKYIALALSELTF